VLGNSGGKGKGMAYRIAFWLKQSLEFKTLNKQFSGISEYPKFYFKIVSLGKNFHQSRKHY
jgi:hypothetical protein